MKASEEGILTGYRVVDVKVDFYDGKMHPVDSKDIGFNRRLFRIQRIIMAPGRACLSDQYGGDFSGFRRLHGQSYGRPFEPAWKRSRGWT